MLSDQSKRHLLNHHRDFEKFARKMLESYAKRFDSVYWSFFSQFAPISPELIVDLGCGPGLSLIDLQKKFPSSKVIGVDAQPEIIKLSNTVLEKYPEIKIHNHDLCSNPLPFEDHCVDFITTTMSFHELVFPPQVIGEVARILKPGGRVLFYDWVRIPLSEYCEGVYPETQDIQQHFLEHCMFSPEDTIWLFEKQGLRCLERIIRHQGRHMLAAFEK